jgi:hypothetical protein
MTMRLHAGSPRRAACEADRWTKVLRVLQLLGLVLLGFAACRTREHVADLGQASETPTRTLPHVFLREHGHEPSLEPMTRRALSAEDASSLAARLANEQCERQYRRRPFKAQQYPAIMADGAYHWGKLDVGGKGGFSALVIFCPDGSEPHVEVYFSSDALRARKLR